MKTKRISQKSLALKYAALGLHVHPLHTIVVGHCSCGAGFDCKHPGKHPRTPNGVKDATIDRKTIKAWWNRWPGANIGIATGWVSDIFVLDVDGDVGKASSEGADGKARQPSKDGHGQDGERTPPLLSSRWRSRGQFRRQSRKGN